MAYADGLRTTGRVGFDDVADLIDAVEGRFGAWTDYTPTLSASGSMTWTTSTTIHFARYCERHNIVHLIFDIASTTGGTVSDTLYFTAPGGHTIPARTHVGVVKPVTLGSEQYVITVSNTGGFTIKISTGANFTQPTAYRFNGSISYEIT